MSAWRRVLHRWAGTLPTIIIEAEKSGLDATQEPLFERGHVFTVTLPLIGEVTCYLHHYLRSDPDRGLHDHPWPWAVALPLAGGYFERRLVRVVMGVPDEVIRRRRPFMPYFLTGFDFHSVVTRQDSTNWSLFFTGRGHFKPWGFLRTTPASLPPGVHYHADPQKLDNADAAPWWRTAPAGRFHRRAPP